MKKQTSRRKPEKVTYGKETLGLYWQHVRRHKPSFFIAVISIPLASVLFDTLVPYWLSMAIGTFASHDGLHLQGYLIYAAVAAAIGVLFNYLGFQMIMYHESAVQKSLAHDTLEQLLLKDSAFFSNQKIGALTSRFIDFVNGHLDIQVLFILRTLNFTINVTLGIGILLIYAPVLAAVVSGFIILLILQVKISTRLRAPLRKARRDLRSESYGLAADVLTNNLTVKTFAKEQDELEHFNDLNERYRQAYIRDYRWMNTEGSGRNLLSMTIQIIAVAVVASLIATGQVTLGIAIFTLAYFQRLAAQIFQMGELLNGYDKILLAAAPMTEILLEPKRVADTNDATELIVNGGVIDFQHVTYAYQDDKDTDIISDFSLHIPSGQKVGLVGASGAGKTTITKLLLRFDDIDNGSIRIDEQNIAAVTQASLREKIAFVPQEPMLFHRSLRDNIAYARPDASEERIQAAAEAAYATEFIQRLPHGFDTVVGERGVKLSGGQRQRIAIARAILKDAPILILDEATSALDSESEKYIQNALGKLMKGRTSVVIAHRLSTIAKLDRIIVLENGTIAEDGTHETLLERKGIYVKLWAHQSGGFIEE